MRRTKLYLIASFESDCFAHEKQIIAHGTRKNVAQAQFFAILKLGVEISNLIYITNWQLRKCDICSLFIFLFNKNIRT